MSLAGKRVLLVGAGGLGSPVGSLLAQSGVGELEVLDDDVIELSNLHRQTLFTAADVGASKATVAAQRLAAISSGRTRVLAREQRLDPSTALALVAGFDVVVEGTDNFPSKFLTSDACALAGVPCVQAGAVRWVGWTMAALPAQSACLRCVFEDIPSGPDRGCSEAGVVGPVVGVVGALQAALALRILRGETRAAGVLHHYRALTGTLRARPIDRASRCPVCSGAWKTLDASRYAPQECAA
jgi:molybdopterin/thiamine biosynthesis adenylyltransferase